MNNKFKDMERNIDSISISVIKSLEKELKSLSDIYTQIPLRLKNVNG